MLCSKPPPMCSSPIVYKNKENKKAIIDAITSRLNTGKQSSIEIKLEGEVDLSLRNLSDWLNQKFQMPLIESSEIQEQKFSYSISKNMLLTILTPKVPEENLPYFSLYSIKQRSSARAIDLPISNWKNFIKNTSLISWSSNVVKPDISKNRTIKAGTNFSMFEGTNYEYKQLNMIHIETDSNSKKKYSLLTPGKIKDALREYLTPFLNSNSNFEIYFGVQDNKTVLGIGFSNSIQNMDILHKEIDHLLSNAYFPPLPSDICSIEKTEVQTSISNSVFIVPNNPEHIDQILKIVKGKIDIWYGEEKFIVEIDQKEIENIKKFDFYNLSTELNYDIYEKISRFLIKFKFTFPKQEPMYFACYDEASTLQMDKTGRLVVLEPIDIWLRVKFNTKCLEKFSNSVYLKFLISNRAIEDDFPFKFDKKIAPGDSITSIPKILSIIQIIVLIDLIEEPQQDLLLRTLSFFLQYNPYIVFYIEDVKISPSAQKVAIKLSLGRPVEFLTLRYQSSPSISTSKLFGIPIDKGVVLEGENLKELAEAYLKGGHSDINWSNLFRNNLAVRRKQMIVIIETIKTFKSGINLINITKCFPGCGASTLVHYVGYDLCDHFEVISIKKNNKSLSLPTGKYLLIVDEDMEIPHYDSGSFIVILRIVKKELNSAQKDFIVDPFLDKGNELDQFITLYKKFFSKSICALDTLNNVIKKQYSHLMERHLFCLILTAVRSEYKPLERFVSDCLDKLSRSDKKIVEVLAFLAIFSSYEYTGLKFKREINCDLLVEKDGKQYFWHDCLAYHVLKQYFTPQTFLKFNDQQFILKIFENLIISIWELTPKEQCNFLKFVLIERIDKKKYSRFITAFQGVFDLLEVCDKINNLLQRFIIEDDISFKTFAAHYHVLLSRIYRLEKNNFDKACSEALIAFNSHPSDLSIKNNYAVCLSKLKRGTDADNLFTQVFENDSPKFRIKTARQAHKNAQVNGLSQEGVWSQRIKQEKVFETELNSNYPTFIGLNYSQWNELAS